MLNRMITDEGLPDGSGKPGEGFVRRLFRRGGSGACRTCSGQPELKPEKVLNDDSPEEIF